MHLYVCIIIYIINVQNVSVGKDSIAHVSNLLRTHALSILSRIPSCTVLQNADLQEACANSKEDAIASENIMSRHHNHPELNEACVGEASRSTMYYAEKKRLRKALCVMLIMLGPLIMMSVMVLLAAHVQTTSTPATAVIDKVSWLCLGSARTLVWLIEHL